MYKNFLLFTGIALFAFASCSPESKCKYKPEPIFESDLPHVLQYNFEKEGQQSLESLYLDTNVLLEISQEVCNATRQEFRFTVKGDFSAYPDSMWLREASRQLVYLSSFSPKQAALKDWADVLEEMRGTMRLGEDKEVQPGFAVQVDRILSPEQSTLVVVLSQE
ncbi:MAG: hypothetical protein EP344_09435 [Bacteroidetes bacterium]|nr:MAG: hypothetical protein EP344_09435 [Bacteroidota bacterium]